MSCCRDVCALKRLHPPIVPWRKIMLTLVVLVVVGVMVLVAVVVVVMVMVRLVVKVVLVLVVRVVLVVVWGGDDCRGGGGGGRSHATMKVYSCRDRDFVLQLLPCEGRAKGHRTIELQRRLRLFVRIEKGLN